MRARRRDGRCSTFASMFNSRPLLVAQRGELARSSFDRDPSARQIAEDLVRPLPSPRRREVVEGATHPIGEAAQGSTRRRAGGADSARRSRPLAQALDQAGETAALLGAELRSALLETGGGGLEDQRGDAVEIAQAPRRRDA